MKKTLLLALAATSISLAGCAADEPDAVVVPVETAEPMAPAVDPMMADTTMMAPDAMAPDAMAPADGAMAPEGDAMAPEDGAMAPESN